MKLNVKKYIIIILTILLILLNINTFTDAETAGKKNLNLYSKSAILIDYDTGSVLYSKNANDKMYPASTTKILTAIIAIEKCNLNDIVTVKKSAIKTIPSGYSSAYLNEDEQISVNNLLKVLLVHSANDAANVLAEHISGTVNDFSNLMNEKAKEIGCKNSHFVNPSGIHDDNHYTTASDLALIAKYCMSNSKFKEYVSMKNCIIPATNKSDARKYPNTNDLINTSSKYYIKECIGIKTGFTSQAQNCLVSACEKDNLTLICVVLGAGTTELGQSARNVDSTTLFEYGYSHYSIKTIASKDTIMKNIDVKKGDKETKNLDLVLANDISALYKSENNDISFDISLNETISAPIAKGTIVGTITYNVNGLKYTENLLASHDVEKSKLLLRIFEILLAIIIIFILIILIKNKTNYKKHKIKRIR